MCCLGCAIFGITEVPTDGVEFDSGDQEAGWHAPAGPQSDPPVIPVPPTKSSAPASNTQYNPPSQGSTTDKTGVWDPERGEARKSFIETTAAENTPIQTPATVIPGPAPATQLRQNSSNNNNTVDLLDSNTPASHSAKTNANGASFDLD